MTRRITVRGVPGLDSTSISDLRNGGLAAIRVPSRAAAIPEAYYWRGVAGVDRDHITETVSLWVRSAFASIARENFVDEVLSALTSNAAGPNITAGTVTSPLLDYATFAATAQASDANRLRAVVLGSTRCGVAAAWNVRERDVVRTEGRFPAIFTTAANGTGPRLTSGHTDAGRDFTVSEVLAQLFDEMDDDEMDLAYMCIRLGMAAAPLAGLSLMETSHHYLSSRLSATRAVERQILGDSAPGSVAIWRANEDAMRDLIWHKACHPIDSGLLRLWGTDPVIPRRLASAGLGSAAVRLPYVEAELKRAGAYIALVDSCAPLLAVANYTVALPKLRAAIEYVKSYPHEPQRAAGAPVPAADPQRPTVRTRPAAVEDVLTPALDKAASIVAWLTGLYAGLAEQADISVGNDTLMRAYSIRKAKANNVAATALGKQAYEAYRRYAMTQADKGTLVGVDMTDDEGTATVAQQQASAAAPPAVAAAGPPTVTTTPPAAPTATTTTSTTPSTAATTGSAGPGGANVPPAANP